MSQKDDDFLADADDDFDVGIPDIDSDSNLDSDPVEYIDRPVKKTSPVTYAIFGAILLLCAGGGYIFLKQPNLIDTLLHGSKPQPEQITPVQSADVLTPEPQVTAPDVAALSQDDFIPSLEALKAVAASLPPEGEQSSAVPSDLALPEGLPQPDPVANTGSSEQLVPEPVKISTSQADKKDSASPEIVRPNKNPDKSGNSAQPELEFFDSGSDGTIGPGSAMWQAENNPEAKRPYSENVIISSKLTKDRQDSKLIAARNAYRAGRYETALRFYDELYDLNKKDRAVLLGRALVLQKMGRTGEAAKAYDDLLVVDPENKQAVVNMLGIIRQDYPAVAAERLRSLYSKYPDAPEIIAQLGVAQGELKNYEEALQYLTRASSIEPNNPKHFFNMAVIAERMGKSDLAIRYYQRTLEVDSVSGGNKINREVVYDRLSRLRR